MSFADHRLVSVFLRYCEDVATPRSLTVSLMVRHGEWDQLAELRVDPNNYFDADSYWLDATVTEFLRKLESLPTKIDRKAVAIQNFWKAEHGCLRTNLRFQTFIDGGLDSAADECVFRFFSEVRKVIGDVLGRPPLWEELEGRFGPGSTFGDRAPLNTVPDKMSSAPTMTADLWPLVVPWSQTFWSRTVTSIGKGPLVVPGNRFTTVPKDATKDRGIAIEPSINVFYQLALGRAIGERLKRNGLDLKGRGRGWYRTPQGEIYLDLVEAVDGQERHRRVARYASLHETHATIDLSNASDTVSRNLVKFLVPQRWHELLCRLRSPTTNIEGKLVRLEKFSSMGNGFTFELETLIFGAICKVATKWMGLPHDFGHDVHVYGDDMIVPIGAAEFVLSALAWAGFEPNRRKTFVLGPFRESCGGDYFMGQAVRPFYLKEPPSEPQHFISIANGIRRSAAEGTPSSGFRWDMSRRFWFGVLDCIPSHIRCCRGPSDLGDLVIHDEPETWVLRSRQSRRYIRCYRPARFTRVKWKGFAPEVHLAYALYTLRFDAKGVIPRDGIEGYKVGWVGYS